MSSGPRQRKTFGIKAPDWIPAGSAKDIWIGNYDYRYLFTPRWPFCGGGKLKRLPQFFSVNEPMPLVLAIIMGFQHAAAMVGGIIVGPLIATQYNTDPKVTEYLVSATLMASGISSAIHSVRFKIPWTRWYYGTGCISVTGISSTHLTTGLAAMKRFMDEGHTFNEAYGKLLGTLMVTSFAVTFVSLLPPRIMRRIFPNWIAGVVTMIVGVWLIGTSITNWGGGFDCPEEGAVTGCSGNGGVRLPFGSAEYLGLGCVCFVALLFLELFGSPFIRNCEIIIALMIGIAAAGIAKTGGQSYLSMDKIRNAQSFTFFWVHTFPLGIYPEAIIPFCIGFLADAANAAGDITATEEASLLETEGPRHDERIQGGLMGDGGNSFLAALATSLPLTVYAQNNGIISFTLCASRVAGVFCGIWLFVFGVVNKVGSFFAYAPNCVMGGIMSFLFGSILVSGIKIMTHDRIDRRTRFIMCVATCVGVGVTFKPDWALNALWLETPGMSEFTKSIRESVILVLSTGYAVAWIICIVLHNIIPDEVDAMQIYQEKVKELGLPPGSAIPDLNEMMSRGEIEMSAPSRSSDEEDPPAASKLVKPGAGEFYVR